MFEEFHKPETEKRVIKIIKGSLGLLDDHEVKPKHQLGADLGGDSLDITEMVIDLEAAFQIELSDDLKWETFTVADVVRHVGNALEDKRFKALVK